MNTHIVNSTKGRSKDAAELRAKIAAADADAKENWFDPEWRRERAKDIATTIYEGFDHESFIDLLADTEYVDDGEDITIEDVRGLEAFWISEGGTIDASRLVERVWRLRPDQIGYHVFENEEKMRSGFSRKSSQLVSLAINQMDAGINQRYLALCQAAIPSSSSPYYIGTSGLSLPALNTGITEVQDSTLSDEVSIVGRATMVNQIMDELADQNGFTPETNEEMLRLGRLGTYRGANIIRLRNFRDARDRPFFPANELYIVGKDASKVGFWGGLTSKEWDEPGGDYWHNKGKRKAGMVVHKPKNLRRYVDTSMAA